MTDRRRIAITTEHAVDGPSRVTSIEELLEVLDDLGRWGPEPEGIVVEVNEQALEELPGRWRVEEIEDD